MHLFFRSAVIRCLQGLLHDPSVAVAFIYFNYNHDYTVIQVIEALLKQLARRRFSSSNMATLGAHMEKRSRPTLDELLQVLKSELMSYSRCFIAIDALDECTYGTRFQLVHIMQGLSGIAKSMITSRDLPEISEKFETSDCQAITADCGDMEILINHRISSCPRLMRLVDDSAKGSLRQHLVTRVINKSEHRWVYPLGDDAQ
jgi:hypothetical protein